MARLPLRGAPFFPGERCRIQLEEVLEAVAARHNVALFETVEPILRGRGYILSAKEMRSIADVLGSSTEYDGQSPISLFLSAVWLYLRDMRGKEPPGAASYSGRFMSSINAILDDAVAGYKMFDSVWNAHGQVLFISHDSRDKAAVARPLAEALTGPETNVWYDEYSLRLGDSLRETVERGLRSSHRCVLVLSKNFLSNEGWTKSEFNAIFTRELVEKKKLVLPIWIDVEHRAVFEYSPVLADRVAAKWSEGLTSVVSKIRAALEP